MASINTETLAGIRLLVCMAKADGVLRPDERFHLEDALAGMTLPDNLTLDKLLDEKNDPAQLAATIQSHEVRDSTYAAVFALAYCDREMVPQEGQILNTLRKAWNITEDEEHALINALKCAKEREHHTKSVPPVLKTEAEREAAFSKVLRRYTLLTALTGAVPLPLLSDLLVIPLQVKMVYDIGRIFNQKTESKDVQLMFETLGVGTGVRLGVSSLSKLVPAWGSVVGAASAYATTYALAKVSHAYYKSEGQASMESLKPLFERERASGRQEYQKDKAALSEAQRHHAEELKQLAYDLQHGKITHKEYEAKVDALGS